MDFEGAVKVFDAIESLPEGGKGRPKLVLVSALDVRNPDVIPKHYVSVFARSFLCVFSSHPDERYCSL